MHNPFVPETLEGWSVLHLMYRVRWGSLRALTAEDRRAIADEAVLIERGRVAMSGVASAVADDPRVVASYLGSSAQPERSTS